MIFETMEPRVEKLTPPILSAASISQEIVCTRPMREDKFNISVEDYWDLSGSKTIVNCYGHGGSGWTTLFGSVNKALSLLKNSKVNQDTPIRIIGSGCMGLTAAIELSREGYNVVGIATKDKYDIPSWKAAGYFALVSIQTSPEEQADLNNIGMHTFLVCQQIAKGQHPYLSKESVRFLPVYCSSDTDSGVGDLAKRGLIPLPENVTLDFGNGVTHKGFVKYMTYFISTTQLMRQLTTELNRLNIPIEINTIKSFSDVKETIIYNCSGIGSRELNCDPKMIPVRGHLFTLNENSGTAHMDYMIYTKVVQNDKEEYIYIFPKDISVTPDNTEGIPCRGVIGGTFIPYVGTLPMDEQARIDQLEFEKMKERNAVFFTGKPFNP